LQVRPFVQQLAQGVDKHTSPLQFNHKILKSSLTQLAPVAGMQSYQRSPSVYHVAHGTAAKKRWTELVRPV
jgi:hypothetical protein